MNEKEKTENCIVMGAYEDRAELMNDEQYFSIKLDCLIMPEERLVVKRFYGTLAQIADLMNHFEEDEWSSLYYASTICAWRDYQCGILGAVHTVGNAQERLLTPLSEVCRSAYLVDNPRWTYRNKFGCTMCAKADLSDADQLLLQDGDHYLRCVRFWFEGLSHVHSEKGWIPCDGKPKGIPYMIVCYEEGAVTSALYVLEEEYTDLEAAKQDMQQGDMLSYTQISRELFSDY